MIGYHFHNGSTLRDAELAAWSAARIEFAALVAEALEMAQ